MWERSRTQPHRGGSLHRWRAAAPRRPGFHIGSVRTASAFYSERRGVRPAWQGACGSSFSEAPLTSKCLASRFRWGRTGTDAPLPRADGAAKCPADQVIDAVARDEPVAGRVEAGVDDAPHHALDPLGRDGGVELAVLLPSPDLRDEDLVDRARDRGVRAGGLLPVEANRNSTRSPTWTMALMIRSTTSSTGPEPGAASTIAAWRAAQESLVSADRRCSRSGK